MRKSHHRGVRLGIESLEQRLVMSAASIVDYPLEDLSSSPTEQTSPAIPQVASLLNLEEWARSLNYTQFGQLTPESIIFVTPAQLATIPNSDWFVAIPGSARAALSPIQVRALNTASITIGLLLPQQVAQLSTAQIQSLKFYDFELLAPSQIPLLTPAQIATISGPSTLLRWSVASKAALTVPQVQAIDVADVWIIHLTPTQVGWLTISQVRSVRTDDMQLLRPEQVKYLTGTQLNSIVDSGKFAVWPETTRAALTLPQVQSLNIRLIGISYLFDNQVGWLTQTQIQSLRFFEFERLFPGQIPLLTPTQIASIPEPSTFYRWSAEQKAALTLPQVQAINVAKVRIDHLTPTQVDWLTYAQVQALRIQDITYLTPQKVPLLSTIQVAAVSTPAIFSSLSHQIRVSLTPPQVQALNISAIGIGLLANNQVQWLSSTQVRSLVFYEFERLSPAQISLLTTAQLASITDDNTLARWSAAQRAALTLTQIRTLNVAALGIVHFTPLQVSWLYPSQVRTLQHTEFQYLNVNQIQYLTRAQMSIVPSGEVLLRLSDEARSQLTRTQLLSLSWKVWAEYTNVNPELAPPENYGMSLDELTGSGEEPVNPHMAAEEAKAYALVPLATATHTTIGTGVWSNPAIWAGGRVPTAGARVVISAGTMVHFDGMTTEAFSTLRIDGVMRFFTNRDTRLKADTIVVTSYGSLFVGAVNDPIQDAYTASIVIADNGPINTKWDPNLISRGIISMGSVTMYGKTVTPYATLAVNPTRGSTTLRFNQPLINWKVGDTLVIAGNNATFGDYFQEERVIRAISGVTVIVDPLYYDHFTPAGSGLSTHVANLSRNVQLTAEDPTVVAERPHLMFMHNPAVNLNNIAVEGFGRTDKSVPLNDPIVINGVLQPGTGTNPRARYAMHFHHTGVNPTISPAVVKGSVVIGSPGWGFVNHSSNVLMDNNVAVGVYGSSFVTEDGNEIGTMIRNLSLATIGAREGIGERRDIHDFGFRGNGFWMQGPGVSLIDNIAAGNSGAGFAYFTASAKSRFDAVNLENPTLAAGHAAIPVGAVPFREFSGNIAYGSRIGLEIWHHQTLMPGDRTVIDNFTSWNTFDVGIDIHYSGNITIRDSTIISDIFGIRGVGVQTNWLTHDVSFENLTITGFQIGIEVPVRGNNVIMGGRISALQGIFIEKAHNVLRTVYIPVEPTFVPLSSALLAGQTQYNYFMYGNYSIADFNLRSGRTLYDADDIQIETKAGTLQLYYYEQSFAAIPFPAEKARNLVPNQYLDKTNLQLQQLYGISFAGGMFPAGAEPYPGVFGRASLLP